MNWPERTGRAGMMGLAWATAWLLPGMIAGRIYVGELEPEHIGGPLMGGFILGTFFAAIAGIASGRRRLAEMPLVHAALLGAVAGVLAGLVPFAIGDASGGVNPWILWPTLIAGMTLVGTVSAIGSVLVARIVRSNGAATASSAH